MAQVIIEPNYPDILGYLTQGERLTIANVVEVAMAVHPAVARTGRPFEVIAIMQNVTDVNLQITAVLQIPPKDMKNKEGKFLIKNDRLSITLHPAETGYLVLPVSSQLDTAPGDYRIGIEFDVKPLDKPRRVRQKPEDKKAVNLHYYFSLTEESLNQLSALKSLTFTAEKRGMFSRGVEAPFRLATGKEIKPFRRNPEWVSLWSLGTDTDVRPLLERYHTVLTQKVLPQMTAFQLYQPLYNSTRDRIYIAGYQISDVEIHYIVKLMVEVLQLSAQGLTQELYPGENMYRVAGTIKKGWPTDGSPIALPNWCRKLLYTIGFDNRVLENPIEALSRPLYEDLMRDAIWHGFKLLHAATNTDLGSDDDIRAYSNQIIKALWEPDVSLDFLDVHMPLVLGGLLVDERVKMASENKFDYLHELLNMYETRAQEYGEDMALFFELGEYLVDGLLQKYGFWTT